jgi:chromosome segregation ATPase
MDGKMKTNEQKITEACTRALERGRDRVKLPAAVVRQLMTELEFHQKQSEWWRAFSEKRGETIVELRGQVEDATIKAKDRYEGMVTLTKMINKMGEAVEKAETRATAAEADVLEMADSIRDLRDRVADLQASLHTQEEAINTANARAAAVAEDAAIRVAAAEAATVAAETEEKILDTFIRENVPDWNEKMIAFMKARETRK